MGFLSSKKESLAVNEINEIINDYAIELIDVVSVQQAVLECQIHAYIESGWIVRVHDGDLTDTNLFDPEDDDFYSGFIFLSTGEVYYSEQDGEEDESTYVNVTDQMKEILKDINPNELVRNDIIKVLMEGECDYNLVEHQPY